MYPVRRTCSAWHGGVELPSIRIETDGVRSDVIADELRSRYVDSMAICSHLSSVSSPGSTVTVSR
jgi:hypothetical protein